MQIKKSRSGWSKTGMIISGTGFVLSGLAAIVSLRSNNLKMLELRQKVLDADETADPKVFDYLADLQNYVSRHMHTNPPALGDQPAIQLKGAYDRAMQAQTAAVSTQREAIAREATAHCESAMPNTLLSNRAACVAEYIGARPVAEPQVVSDLYRYDFAAPRWSPDIAGWSIVMVFIFGGLLLIQLISRFIAGYVLKS